MAGFAYPTPIPAFPLKGKVKNVPETGTERIPTPIPAFPLKGKVKDVPETGTERIPTPIPARPRRAEQVPLVLHSLQAGEKVLK